MFRRQTSFALSSFWMGTLLAVLIVCLPRPTVAQGTALDLDGKSVDPFQAARGKVVALIFVRTDCPISNRYAPTIQNLSTKYADQAAFWLVYPSNTESAKTIRKHDHDFRYELPALRDPQRVLVELSHAQITPEAAVFDAARRLIYHGRIDNLYEDFGHARKEATTHELDDAIRAVIEKRAPLATHRAAVGCYIADLR
jgi:thiol-disulfide isomerase/thioredoxin